MIAFSIAAGILLLASMAFVLWPLWWGKQAAGSRREANVAVYEQHAAEIDNELAAGQITADAADARRNELDAQLLSDVDEAPGSAAYTAHRPWLTSTTVIVGFAVFAIGLYGLIGDTRGITRPQAPDISAIVAKMKARLEAAPDDIRTRALLGQVQLARQQYDAAARTFAAINARMDEPDVVYLLAEARARVLGNGGRVGERAQALYNKVLKLSPNNTEALWFAGLAALADGKSEIAARRWQRLLAQDIPQQFRARVQRRLAEVQGELPDLETGG